MILKIIPLTKNKLLVLEEIYKYNELNLSSIAKNLNLSNQLIFRTLKELNPILNIKKLNKIKLYSIKEEYLLDLKNLIEKIRLEKSLGIDYKLINLIKNSINIEKIYLFGSYAKNKQNKNSDLDLIIVSQNNKEEIYKIIEEISKKTGFSIQIILFNREKFNKILKNKSSNFYNIINNKYERIEIII